MTASISGLLDEDVDVVLSKNHWIWYDLLQKFKGQFLEMVAKSGLYFSIMWKSLRCSPDCSCTMFLYHAHRHALDFWLHSSNVSFQRGQVNPGHGRQPREKWQKVKNETYGWHAPAAQVPPPSGQQWGVPERWGDVKNDMPWKISYSHGSLSRQKGALFDSVAAVLMTSSTPFVREGEKGKDGTKENISQRVFKETDFLPHREEECWHLPVGRSPMILISQQGIWTVLENCALNGQTECRVQSMPGRERSRKSLCFSKGNDNGV